MKSTIAEPTKLRPEIIHRIETLADQDLVVLHRVLQLLEKQRLWNELSAEAEADRQAGRFDRLPEVIQEARAELRKR